MRTMWRPSTPQPNMKRNACCKWQQKWGNNRSGKGRVLEQKGFSFTQSRTRDGSNADLITLGFSFFLNNLLPEDFEILKVMCSTSVTHDRHLNCFGSMNAEACWECWKIVKWRHRTTDPNWKSFFPPSFKFCVFKIRNPTDDCDDSVYY